MNSIEFYPFEGDEKFVMNSYTGVRARYYIQYTYYNIIYSRGLNDSITLTEKIFEQLMGNRFCFTTIVYQL